MAAPDNYTVASGLPIYGGRAAPGGVAPGPASPYQFKTANVSYVDRANANPYSGYFAGQLDGQISSTGKKPPLYLVLHGSSGSAGPDGRLYTAVVDGAMAFTEDTDFQYVVVLTADGVSYTPELRPVDNYTGAGALGESSHIGFVRPDGKFYLTSEHRYDAVLDWVDNSANTAMSKYDLRRRVIGGGSMGAWGTITYGVRRYSQFAALYADRPRWRWGSSVGKINLTVWGAGKTDFTTGQSPALAAEDGTGSAEDYINMTAYVANTANKVRWIGWCVGRQDGFSVFQDHIDAVAAMRAAKRGFCFAWNNGDHSTGSIMNSITASYPVGTFSRDLGYPLFTSHSLDKDPSVDLVGMINGNLAYRNVIETSNGWTCEVTSIAAACTVDVEPISDVFTKAVAKKNVVIPAANTWVPVSFS